MLVVVAVVVVDGGSHERYAATCLVFNWKHPRQERVAARRYRRVRERRGSGVREELILGKAKGRARRSGQRLSEIRHDENTDGASSRSEQGRAGSDRSRRKA